MKLFISILLVAVALSGCSYKEYNAAVERQNNSAFSAFAEGMSKQTSEAGRLALSIVFITGSGRQKLARPETVATYLPMVNGLIMPWIAFFHHGGDNSDNVTQSYEAGRDIYFQSSNSSTHTGHELMSLIKGDGNETNQYICPTCEGGVEVGDDPGDDPGDDFGSCIRNPPAGYQGSLPLYSPGCSCKSHYHGRC